MIIGTSLPPSVLRDAPVTEADKMLLDAYGGHMALLRGIGNMGVGAIELRSIRPDTPEAVTAACAADVLNSGLKLTVHATLTDTTAEGFFAPLRPALKLIPREHGPTPLTVHSLRTGSEPLDQANTVRMLKLLADYAADRGWPVILALENNRIHRSGLSIMDCHGVEATVREADRPNVGVCFDFGHLYSNFLTYPECTPFLPSEGFFRRVAHTHIHGVEHTTHYPLRDGNLPLRDYLARLLAVGYAGLFNLELECGRYWRDVAPREGYEMSVQALRACLTELTGEPQ